MGRLEVMAKRSNTTGDMPSRQSPSGRRRLVCVAAFAVALADVAVLMTGGAVGAASPPAGSIFNGATQLVGTAGAVPTSAVAQSNGGMLVVGSTAAGDGCTLSTLGHDGATAVLLGRTPGGVNCEVTELVQPSGSDGAAVVSQTATGLIGGNSGNGGATFGWSNVPAIGTPRGLAADPAPTPGSVAELFLIVQDPHTGVPYIAVSTDAGVTFSIGASLIDPSDISAVTSGGQDAELVVGNLVARRTSMGLVLYSVLETGGPTAAETSVSGHVLRQVYEAVGTVTPATPGGQAPAVAWRDSEVYTAPEGVSLDARGAVTTVDGTGRIFTAFSDGGHLYVKSDAPGLPWDLFLPPIAVNTSASGAPAGADIAFAPSIAAGGDGMVDVAWLESTGSVSTPSSAWRVFMAQTIDGGSSWHAYPVTRAAVHNGTPAGSVQMVVDQNSGAASLA
jgi:hypothetical protein